MKKIYCGGSFNFDYLKCGDRDDAAEDYRAVLLGGADLLLERNGCVKINENVEYIGPFYFETDGMKDRDIVHSEWEMVKKCTDAIFLLDGAGCPGTVCELTAASMLGKRVHIFYIRKGEGEETESDLHTPCWYPIIHSLAVNEKTAICKCFSAEDAIGKICDTVKKWEKNHTP